MSGIEGISAHINQIANQINSSGSSSQIDINDLAKSGATEKSDGVDFSAILKSAVNEVNEQSQATSALREAYEKGDPNVSLTEVMVAAQKSSVGFQALVQTRNQLLNAYQEIMRLPV